MIAFIRHLAFLGLASIFFTGPLLHSTEPQAPPTPDETKPGKHTAKIVSIDTTKRTLTLQSKGANHLFFVDPKVTNTRTRQQINLDQLANGEFISFVTRPESNGQLEVVSLMILHNESGNPSGGGIHGGRADVSPFK
jgi:hypothetical protein